MLMLILLHACPNVGKVAPVLIVLQNSIISIFDDH